MTTESVVRSHSTNYLEFNFKQRIQLRTVIPGRAKREPGIHNHDREYGFRACAKWRIHDVHLHIGE
jgi:hypothetical protein